MKVGTGIGIAALVIAIIGAFVPGVGLFVGWFALVVASIGALCGDKGLAIATVLISAVAFVFLTPTLWLEFAAHETGYGAATGRSRMFAIISMALLAAPIISMLLFSTGKFALRKRQTVGN